MDSSSSDHNGLLYNWLTSLPAGSSSSPVVVMFQHDGCYLVNGGIFVRNFQDYVFDGNGSTFEQVTTPASGHPVLYNADPSANDYCGSDTSYGSSDSYTAIYPIIWWFDGGCDISVENMTIKGPYSGSGGGGSDQQNSGIQFSGVQRSVVTNTTIMDVNGDFATISGLWELGETYSGEPSTDATVTNNIFNGAGRQGVTPEYVNRVSVSDNTFTNVTANDVDIEADEAGGDSNNISISNNTIIGTPVAGFTLAALTGTAVNNLAFTDNQLKDSGQMRVVIDSDGLDNATITGNVATGVDSSSSYGRPAIEFEDTSDGTDYTESESNILVANNTIPSSPWNHGEPIEGSATVDAGGSVNNLQVEDNNMPLTYGSGVPTTYNQVLPLWQYANPPTLYGSPQNDACGNTQGGTETIYYGSACASSDIPPTQPTASSLPGDFPSTSVIIPSSSGAALSGSQTLDAVAASSFGVTNVEFELTGGTLHQNVIATATPNAYGDLATWNSDSVPDGTYALQSVASDASGDSNVSPGITVTIDNGTQPITSVASPSNGASLSGGEWLAASASDSGSSISGVEFQATGAGVTDAVIGTSTLTEYGYLFDWNTTNFPDGNYMLQSVAFDVAGNMKTSTGISVIVNNNPAPATSVLTPSGGASLSGSETLDASATSTFGIANVEFVLTGGTLTDDVIAAGAPTEYGYLTSWNTTTVPDGTYTLQSLAYDEAANSTFSPGITVTVNNCCRALA